jgi:hypothetical protein
MVPSFLKEPYNKINLLLAGVIFAIFIYSGIFSAEKDNHPVLSFYPETIGKESPTKGISRSFSEIIRGRINEARQWNENGIPVFFFFFIQLFLRLGITLLHHKRTVPFRILLLADIFVSVSLFIFCFQKLLLFWKFY